MTAPARIGIYSRPAQAPAAEAERAGSGDWNLCRRLSIELWAHGVMAIVHHAERLI